jgi:vacuolar protein sorting-associated protein 13D
MSIVKASSIRISFWVPYWIVNKSGIPLIIRQDVGVIANDAAGQFDEHESAKDKNPLMFSFAVDNSPKE